MKFAIRDDDLNFFFEPEKIEKDFQYIWDICPISMSVVPFIKGNWPKYFIEAEERGPGIIDDSNLSNIKSDDTVYPIGDNIRLVNYIKSKIAEHKVYLTIHAIHHRNEDKSIPQFVNNFGIGAEFYTERDLTEPLFQAVQYLQNTFGQTINVFTPPQNILSPLGFKAVQQNRLSICGDLPSTRRLENLRLFGVREYLKLFSFKIIHRGTHYPYPIKNNHFKIIGHHRLQPSTDQKLLYLAFENAYRFNGGFVVSTHSYGFDFKMKNTKIKMGEVLKNLVSHAAKKPNVQFTNLKEIFE